MRVVVTGTAGFIGSQLAEDLVDDGVEVLGMDAFTATYPAWMKRRNLEVLAASPRFGLYEGDLVTAELEELFSGVDTVFHLAAIPGVRASWSHGFTDYVHHNVLGLQRVLEAARVAEVPRVVWASSSSVYGNTSHYPTREGDLTRPHSPYGVTKLAGEHLCRTYADNFGVDVVGLRYFSVYGPRQRPDMGVHRICEAALDGDPFCVFGTGHQVRDMTYVGDVVRATRLAADADVPPATFLNVAGGSSVSVRDLITLVGDLAGTRVRVRHDPAQPGDVQRTGGDTEQAAVLLGWQPAVGLEAGLAAQLAWHRALQPDRRAHVVDITEPALRATAGTS